MANNTRHINKHGLRILKSFEGLRLKPYLDDNDGWTIGYGHKYPRGTTVPKEISEQEAETLLKKDLAWAERVVTESCPEWLTGNQFSALVDFVYNIGATNFKTSTLFRKLSQGDTRGVAKEFYRWRFDDGKEMPGLARRRLAEQQLFMKDSEG